MKLKNILIVVKDIEKAKIWLVFYLIFIILTLLGAILLFMKKLDNAGMSVCCLVMALGFGRLYDSTKKNDDKDDSMEFVENKFEYMKWDVELIQNPVKLERSLKNLSIWNKRIDKVKTISIIFDEDEKRIQIDKPLEFIFEDNNKLEIDYSEGSTIKLGVNSIPIYEKYNVPIFLERYVVGEAFIGFDIENVDESDAFLEFTGSYGLELEENQTGGYIGRLTLKLTNNKRIIFYNYFDYGEIFYG